MHYNTTYYIEGYDFFKEEDNHIMFDEYHYLQSKEKSPIECYTEKKINMIELKRLIRILPEDKLIILLRKLLILPLGQIVRYKRKESDLYV